MTTLRLLGEVAAWSGGERVDLGPARQRCVLAALAVDVGRVVPVDRLVDRVWGGSPPPRTRTTLSSYLSRLRGALAGVAGVELRQRSGGYLLAAEARQVDVYEFRRLCTEARRQVDGRVTFTEALALWRGDALTGLAGDWAEEERDRLHDERFAVECDLNDARLALGEAARLLPVLAAHAARRPLDERVAGQYVLALYQAGHTAGALEHHRHVRELLKAELGIEPGAGLAELQRRILAADPTLAAREPAIEATARAALMPVPRQLPAAPRPFVGRHAELERLDDAMRADDGSATVVISAVAGAGGVGKTWLVLHWAHRHVDLFPDGQLFVDLRGFSPDGEPMDPAVAVGGFLDALDVEPARVPAAAHASAALFRSLVADRRMLLVLDNAVDAAQITPLLPGGDTCTVLVTSRDRLSGLATRHAARQVPLDVLSAGEARALLVGRLGADRVDAEPAAVDELVRLCGGFPLALSIVAAQAGVRTRSALADLADELRELGLDALHDVDPTASLPSVLSWSSDALPPEHATAFALLGTAPGLDIGHHAAAALLDLTPVRAKAVLRALEHASLVAGVADGRYRMHDLIRQHAVDRAGRLTDGDRAAAARRVVDFYLHTARDGDRLLDPYRPPLDLDAPEPGVGRQPLPDADAAYAWFDTERRCLLAAQHTAVAHGLHRVVWQLAHAMTTFQFRGGYLHDDVAVWERAAASVEREADLLAVVLVHRFLGRSLARVGRHDGALHHLERSLAAARVTGDFDDQAHAEAGLAQLWEARGSDERALEHATAAMLAYRAAGNRAREAQTLNGVGWYAAKLGRHDDAREHCRAALALQRDLGEVAGEADTLDSLGYIDHETGRHADAIAHYGQALALFRSLGHAYQVGSTLEHLGHPHIALGDRATARAAWTEARALFREQGREDAAERVQRQLDALAG